MEWRWTEPLESEELISEFEKKEKYIFPKDFAETLRNYNAGYPDYEEFISYKGNKKIKRVFSSLLSINKDSMANMWQSNDNLHRVWAENGELDNYVNFAIDPFGNKICFDKTNNHIVFIDHETLSIEPVADSFSELINSLKEIK